MTGIFGYYGQTIEKNKIFDAIKNIGYNIKEITEFNSCLLGATGIKSPIEKNLTLKTDNDIAIVTCGKIFNEEAPDLQTRIINFYKTGNLNRLKELNGSFAAILYDVTQAKLILMNDRFGTIKIFYFSDKNCLYFAPKIQPLIEWGAKKTIRKDAIYDFFSFGFLLGEKTFFKDIYQLPPASILEKTKNETTLTQYWDYKFDYTNNGTRPKKELIDELGKIWEKSVERRISKGEKIIVPLSGGYDSRAILAAVLKYTPKENITTFTFGEKGSFDFEIGKLIAEKACVKNEILGVEKEDFEVQNRISFKDTEGMIDATPYCAIKEYQKLKKYGDQIWSGFMGGEIMGSLVMPKMMNYRLKSKKDYEHAKNLIFSWRIRYNEKIIKKLCSPLLKNLPDIRDSFNQTMKDIDKIDSKQFIDYCTTWLYKYEEWNYTSFCVLRFQNLYEYPIPFLDYDLVDFMLKIPPKLRLNKDLYETMLIKKYPELFALPTKNNSGHPINTDDIHILLREIGLYLKRKFNTIFIKITKRNYFQDPHKNYIDYDNLLRTNREYQKYISYYINKVKEREYFNKEFIEEIWELQINGQDNYAMLFGLLVTFELLLEKYVDNPEIIKIND